MKTVRIKQEFHDKDNFSKIYPVGSVCSFEDERAHDLVSRDLAEIISDTDEKPVIRSGRKSFDE